ncbi:MAG: T9SS type A sorting domain-containing protein [Paludibacter sp.]
MRTFLHSVLKSAFILAVIFSPLSLYSQALLNANGTTDTYSLINSILAPGATAEETPDAFDPSFGPHIKQVWDTDLGKYVFEFYLHISNSNELQDESTGDTDRQRVEIKTYASSPDSMKGTVGETVLYKWRFKIPVGFQPSPSFTHIHQVKAVDGDDSDPIFTLTPRYNANGNQLELIYVQDVNSGTSKLATVDISSFLGTWVEATEQIYVDSINGAKNGSYSIVIKKVSDGTTLLSYSNNNISTIRKTTNSFIRPKWGIYRSITNISYLRDETMRFNSFSVQEIKNQSQTITFGSLTGATYGDVNFDPGAVSSSNLNITYSSSNTAVATIVNDSVHVVAPGTTNITSYQTGNASFAAATPVSQSLTVNKADQTIAFGAITKAVGDADFSPAIASSGLTCTYQSSNSAVATIVSGKVHIVGTGTTTITASQVGNTNFNAATDNAQTLTVTSSALYVYSPTSITITSGSTGSGSYANLASNDASYLRINSTTSSTRKIDWYASTFVSQSASSIAKLIVNFDGKNQSSKTQILYLYNFSGSTWDQIDSRSVSSSDVTITYELANPTNYISAGGEIRLRVYTSGGTQNYVSNTDWIQFTLQNITKSNQTITFNTLATKTYGDADFSAGATASSGLAVSYTSSNTAVATIVNNQIHVVGAGNTNITASQAGDGYTNAAADVTQTLTVSKLNQTITFGAIASKSIGMADFDPTATASSGLGVTYNSSNTAVATIVSGLVHIVGIGTSTITTSQAGDSNTNAAPDATQLLTVTAATTVLMEEIFNYSATNIENESSWTTPILLAATGTTIVGTGKNIVSPALTYTTAGRTYILSGVGKKINSDYSSGASDYKNYKPFTASPISSGTVYLSFLLNPGVTQSQSQSEVIGMATGTSAGAKVWIGKGALNSSYYRFGTTRGSTTSADIKWSATEFSDITATQLVVLKYDFSTATSSIYLNPTIASLSEPTADITDNTSSAIRTSLNNLWFRINGSSANKYNLSSVRVSTSWSDAVASATMISQSITFNALATKLTTDADFTPGATASSGLTVAYASSNTSVATIVNNQIHIIGSGTTIITASQGGNTNFSAATNISQTLIVNKQTQTITFGALSSRITSDADFSPGATASSGLSVSYASSNAAVATIVNNQIHITGAGNTTITASQAGNSIHNAALDITQTLTVNNITTPQTITFGALSDKTYGDVDFAPGATSSSGLTVTYISSNTSVATIVNSLIHIVGAGTSIITASQTGNTSYNAATDVSQTLTVNKLSQTLTFGALVTKITTDADFAPGATASSGMTVSYSSSNTSVATIVNNQIHITGAGTTTITASQSGNSNYSAATALQQILTINKLSQSITFGTLATKFITDADFSPAATASSGLTVTYSSSNTAVVTIVNNQIHIVGVGTSTITASQAGDGNYSAASGVSQTLMVTSIYMDETFNYTASTNINGQSSWTTAGSYVGGTGYTIGADNLTYADANGSYALSATGKSFVNNIGTTATDYKAYKPFSASSISTGAIYLSFLMKANGNIVSTNQELFGLADVLNAGPKVLIGKTTSGFFKIGTVRASTTSTDYKYATSPTVLTVGNTYLIVLKYDLSTNTSTVYINPAIGGTEAAATAEVSDNTSTTYRTKLSNLWVRATGTVITTSTVGAVRVSANWTDAVAKYTSGTVTQIETPVNNEGIKVAGKTIIAPETGTIEVYNLQGKLLLQRKNTNALITCGMTGLYIARFRNTNNQIKVQKIIIQ